MLAATFRSCFGTCFKGFGGPAGYDTIEESPRQPDSLERGQSQQSLRGIRCDKGYDSLLDSALFNRSGLDYRSKSTSEIFRSNDYHFTKADKRAFSVSFGYLNDTDHLFESLSQEIRSTMTSAADLRSDVSEAFWSCKGSRSTIWQSSDPDFYSDDSEEAHQTEDPFMTVSVCEACGLAGKVHNFDDKDRCRWRDTAPSNSLPVPRSEKWIQLD